MFEVPIKDKFSIIFDLIKSSFNFWIIIGLSLIFMLLLLIFKKRRKIIFSIFMICFVAAIVLFNYKQLGYFLDYFVEVLLNLIYFPNFCLYSVLFISLNIVMLNTLFSRKTLEHNRKIVITVYCVVAILFSLVISTIGNLNINLNDKIALYSNKKILSLIEISTFIIAALYIYLLFGLILKKMLHSRKENELSKTTKLKPIQDTLPNFNYNKEAAVNSFGKFINAVPNNSLSFNEIETNNFDSVSNALIDLYSES